MNTDFDITYEVHPKKHPQGSWEILVDRKLLGSYKSKIDAVQYARSLARETWEDSGLSTIVYQCAESGAPRKIAEFGG